MSYINRRLAVVREEMGPEEDFGSTSGSWILSLFQRSMPSVLCCCCH